MSPGAGDPDGAALAAAIRAGNPDAEAGFVERYRPRLLHLARRTLFRGEDAEDLVQDVLTSALVALRQGLFRGDGSVGGWLAAILRSKRIDAYRRSTRDPDRLARRETSAVDRPSGDLDALAGAAPDCTAVLEVRRALARLPPLHRTVLVLNQIEGYSTSEIAARLRRPPGTIGRVLAAAKQRLRDAVSAGDEDSRRGHRLDEKGNDGE